MATATIRFQIGLYVYFAKTSTLCLAVKYQYIITIYIGKIYI